MSEAKPGWKTLPEGDVVKAGTAKEFKTGDWRTERPTWFPERCIQCLFCWISCPDSAVLVKDQKMIGFDYDHCKGCGICAKECPVKPKKAIEMGPERPGEKECQK
jgi:pyruvate ferredoxin oxidoreductase delta subunit